MSACHNLHKVAFNIYLYPWLLSGLSGLKYCTAHSRLTKGWSSVTCRHLPLKKCFCHSSGHARSCTV
uniref:Hypothetical secreted protein 1739 n=1 Tax=Amblyomma variegatum TaxID=34610 RepID=F0J9Y2_AMBVA|nr:TPA_inf: hypothetical secreted protein 1739 [Amblyomma variegatum]